MVNSDLGMGPSRGGTHCATPDGVGVSHAHQPAEVPRSKWCQGCQDPRCPEHLGFHGITLYIESNSWDLCWNLQEEKVKVLCWGMRWDGWRSGMELFN